MNTTEPEIAFLLGLPFHAVTMDQTVQDCVDVVEHRQPRYFVTANADFVAQAYENDKLREILFHAYRSVCDGMPLVWLSRWFKPELPERVAGSDLVFRIFEQADARKWKVFLLGSDDATLSVTTEHLRKRYPQMEVAGAFAPPFAPVDQWPNTHILHLLEQSRPDVLLVAVGCPKQEYWIAAHYQRAGVPLSIGIGASLDFIAGSQVRAPLWIQKIGMEWLWRLSGNPRRLARRYAKDLYYLVVLAWLQRRITRHHPQSDMHGSAKSNLLKQPLSLEFTTLSWPDSVERSTLDSLPMPEAYNQPVLLMLSNVTFMDSSGIGRLVQVARGCRDANVALGLIAPSPAITEILGAMHLQDLFKVYPDVDAARIWIHSSRKESLV